MPKKTNFCGNRLFENHELCGECGTSLGDTPSFLMYNGYFCSDSCKQKYMVRNEVDLNYLDYDEFHEWSAEYSRKFRTQMNESMIRYLSEKQKGSEAL